MMQRRRCSALRKAGFSASVSARALMSFWPIVRSLAQYGTSPERVGHAARAFAERAAPLAEERVGNRIFPAGVEVGAEIERIVEPLCVDAERGDQTPVFGPGRAHRRTGVACDDRAGQPQPDRRAQQPWNARRLVLRAPRARGGGDERLGDVAAGAEPRSVLDPL